MDYAAYAARLRAHDGVTAFAEVIEGGRSYPLYEAVVPGRRTLVITAGFHGDETAGPLTLLERLPEIARYARARDVGLRIFPCLNPSGFEDGTRYNRDGEAPNNDLLRYQVAPGRWVDELPAGTDFLSWAVHTEGPKETRALLAALEREPAPAAALDLHQDPWLEGAFAYAYVFGARAAYRPLVVRTAALVPLAASALVDDEAGVRSDADGIIELHDGSVTDYFYRRGVPITAALETTTRTPMALADQVNLVWIRGFIDLIA